MCSMRGLMSATALMFVISLITHKESEAGVVGMIKAKKLAKFALIGAAIAPRVVIPLNLPNLPSLPGLSSFQGNNHGPPHLAPHHQHHHIDHATSHVHVHDWWPEWEPWTTTFHDTHHHINHHHINHHHVDHLDHHQVDHLVHQDVVHHSAPHEVEIVEGGDVWH